MTGLTNVSAPHSIDVPIKAFEQQPQDDTETYWSDDSSSSFDMEPAILTVQNNSNGCLHHRHCHSFQPIQFLLPGKVCNGCNQKLDAIMFGARNDEFKQIVRCQGCGVVAHRKCAFSRHLEWKGTRTCTVAARKGSDDNSASTIEEEEKEISDIDFDAVLKILKAEEECRGQPQEDVLSTTANKALTECSSFEEEEEDLSESSESSSSSALSENIAKFSRAAQTVVENTKENFQARIGVATSTARNSAVNAVEKLPTKIGVATVAARTSVENAIENLPAKVSLATVAGGIAGGVAGLFIAGPVAALAGGTLGLGAILEGNKRFLLMGERGAAKRVLLVRPSIHIDPEWEKICISARTTMPRNRSPLKLLTLALNTKNKDHLLSRNQRYQCFSDIVQTGEDEISTSDKVFLMVNRILNDKNSLPGHFYRHLIQEFKNRCEMRKTAPEKDLSPRSRRDDAHAVIKHVTATLLEVQPTLGSSPALTELAATAVERLVLGQLYDLLFDEIRTEAQDLDDNLKQKRTKFKNRSPLTQRWHDHNHISQKALDALRMLPGSHSVEDKLHLCAVFLQEIAAIAANNTNESVCADYLLKMVCQHIIACSVECINAEVDFLEEFARDEQLLKGREGYALVTLKASLHILAMSTDFEKDIFAQNDEEENAPVDSIPAPV